METFLEFCSPQACLEVRSTAAESTWFQFWLVQNKEQPRYLGAEVVGVILLRLLNALTGTHSFNAQEWNGQQVHWVFSLAEAHHVLYMAEEGSDRILLWQDAGNGTDVICTMRLSAEQCQAWITKIRSLGFPASSAFTNDVDTGV